MGGEGKEWEEKKRYGRRRKRGEGEEGKIAVLLSPKILKIHPVTITHCCYAYFELSFHVGCNYTFNSS